MAELQLSVFKKSKIEVDLSPYYFLTMFSFGLNWKNEYANFRIVFPNKINNNLTFLGVEPGIALYVIDVKVGLDYPNEKMRIEWR
jgi:hypothetical protein